jgi:mono/diheme cytochrome c family protein
MIRQSSGWAVVFAGIAVSLGIGVTGCRSTPSLSPEEAAGEHLYSIRCFHCHEENDLGFKKAPPQLHGIFDHKTLPSGAPATDAEVRRVVLAGKGLMPAFNGRFSEEQMAALLAYLHTGVSSGVSE